MATDVRIFGSRRNAERMPLVGAHVWDAEVHPLASLIAKGRLAEPELDRSRGGVHPNARHGGLSSGSNLPPHALSEIEYPANDREAPRLVAEALSRLAGETTPNKAPGCS